MKCSSTSRIAMTFGTSRLETGSGTSASMITPNVLCIVVCLYSWFSTTRGIASRLSSITTRMPSRSDSSRRSEMPSSFLSRTSSRDLLHEPRLVHLVRQLGDDDLRLVALFVLLDRGARAHDDLAAPRLDVVLDPRLAVDVRAGREIGPVDEPADRVDGKLRIVDHRRDRRGHLAQVVRRNVRRHADRDAARPVDEQVRQPAGQHRGLLEAVVEVRREIDRVLVDVGRASPSRSRVRRALGIAIRRRGIAVDRSEVPLAVDQRIAQREILHHADERVVHALVAVRMVLAEHVADDRRRLLVRRGPARGRPRSSRTARAGAPASVRRARRGARG